MLRVFTFPSNDFCLQQTFEPKIKAGTIFVIIAAQRSPFWERIFNRWKTLSSDIFLYKPILIEHGREATHTEHVLMTSNNPIFE